VGNKISELQREIMRVKSEIVMGNYNGWDMTDDYKKKLKLLEEELTFLKFSQKKKIK
tara:strand:- start:1 stop:171 length:171 start_codon:yes stop_codon:yes gene_type:complete